MKGLKVFLALLMLGVLTLQSWTYSEFVTVGPGTARPAAELGSIAGVPPSEGRLLYTAVVARRAGVVDGLRSIFDRRVRLVPVRERIPPGIGWSQYSRMLGRAMAESQKVAAAVAFREAGYRVLARTSVVVEAALPGSGLAERVPEGSRLTSVDGVAVATKEEAYELLRSAGGRGTARLVIEPPGGNGEIALEAGGEFAAGPGKHPFGLVLTTVHSFEYPMSFEAGKAGAAGSSAGLMLALELYDRLTGGGLAGSLRVAGTGGLRLDGAVEAVDAVALKVAAAKEAGAKAFVLPRENLQDALAEAEGIVLVPVGTFAEAVEALRWLAAGED